MHAGAVIVPAVLAACERHNPDGRAALLGIAVGVETMCRLSLVAPTRTHKAGFHPTAIFGAMGAAAGVGAALGLDAAADSSMRSASPARWRAASSNIWPKAPGPSACTPAGRRNRACAPRCWRARASRGPRTVFEGAHGLFHGFANTLEGDYDAHHRRFRHALGDRDAGVQALSVRNHDASLYRLRAAARGAASRPTTSRRWSARSARAPCTACGSRSPPSSSRANGYAGKFSTPYCIAAGFVRGNVGLGDFSDEAVRDPAVVALAAKVRYQIDPKNPYPRNFTGHIRAHSARRPRDRGTSAPHARRRARAADAPGHRGQIRAQCPPRRLGRGARASARSRCCARSTMVRSIYRCCAGEQLLEVSPTVPQARCAPSPGERAFTPVFDGLCGGGLGRG